jgi:hypothetical protein
MKKAALTILLLAGSAAAISGCGSGSSLTTGSLIGGPAASQPQGPKPVTASDRALYVASNVARAQRCGFYFDPEQVKAGFLASEQQSGAAPDAMQKITREYDFTRQTVLAAAVKDETYCTEGRTREIKAALSRQLAGDFNPPQKRQDVNIGLFEHQKRERPFDGNKVFEASQKKIGPIGGE